MVDVLDRYELDILLKEKWDGMKNALSGQDIEGGLNYFLDRSKPRYQEGFNIIKDKLPQIINDMQDIELIYAKEGIAKYRINRDHVIGGTPATITYYVYFMVDQNGIWKIDQF
jgi:hypothetical protein